MTKQIIAMGGGGFSMEPENPLLDLEEGVTDSIPGSLAKQDCLEFLSGVIAHTTMERVNEDLLITN
jgi:hypothetical protein